MPISEPEQQQDYIERVRIVAPKVDAILREHNLNLGAQFDGTTWPKALNPVPIYVDTKNYAETLAGPEPAKVTSPEEPKPVESPLQREDLEPGDTSE